jgi:invasion protein IalB
VFLRIIRSAAVLCALTAVPAAAQQGAAETTRTTQGDWTVVCAKAGRPCIMEQVGKTSQGENALSMQIERLPEPTRMGAETVEFVANFLTPLGVLVQEGLELRIDGGEPQRSPYFLCQQNGCVVRAPLTKALVDAFRRGRQAAFAFGIVQNGKAGKVAATVSLTGFTRALEATKG